MAFKPEPRSSETPKVNSEPLSPPAKVVALPVDLIAVSNTPEMVTCACAPKTAAKAATATRVSYSFSNNL
jgi:hypothetical protein